MSKDKIIPFPHIQKEETKPEKKEPEEIKETYRVSFYYSLPMDGEWYVEASSEDEALGLFRRATGKDEMIVIEEYNRAFHYQDNFDPDFIEVQGVEVVG